MRQYSAIIFITELVTLLNYDRHFTCIIMLQYTDFFFNLSVLLYFTKFTDSSFKIKLPLSQHQQSISCNLFKSVVSDVYSNTQIKAFQHVVYSGVAP